MNPHHNPPFASNYAFGSFFAVWWLNSSATVGPNYWNYWGMRYSENVCSVISMVYYSFLSSYYAFRSFVAVYLFNSSAGMGSNYWAMRYSDNVYSENVCFVTSTALDSFESSNYWLSSFVVVYLLNYSAVVGVSY